MSIPRATYRLQFRNGMTFEKAAEIVPYLAALGISHLYASPIFTAAPGSTHGYDVADHQAFDPVLGGEEGFVRLAEALKQSGLGLILDIVPNHMAVSTANPWWRDVLKHGRDSTYARHFDIDWEAPKLLLPVLGEPYGQALAENKLEVRIDKETGEPAFGYYELLLPLAPDSLAGVLNGENNQDDALGAVNKDKDRLHRLHEAQMWRLAYWRLAREALTYRRFFEIADLVGVRVEDAAVFADVHQLPLRLVEEGVVDGLRIDHIDGLADPKGYLSDLKRASGLDYVLVEKILGRGEALRADWACAGTTGYEFARLVTALQVDPQGRAEMTRGWTGVIGDDADFAGQVLAAKRRMLTVNLAGELAALVRLAEAIAVGDLATRDFGRDALRLVIVELAAAWPVYRTYIDRDGASQEDRALIERAVEKVQADRVVEDERVVDFVASLLLEPAAGSKARTTFITRFQQTTGPLMAKAMEDTVFYRYNRLIALNEVGAEPDVFGIEPEAFHAAMRVRAAEAPLGLSATATHDTKRGEDARARLAALSEVPAEWASAVARWHDAASGLRQALPDGSAPAPETEWLLYQALAGVWPADLSIDDEEGLQALCDRLAAFMTKALREAKQRTSWTDPNEPFEAAVESYVRHLFAPERRTLLQDVRAVIGAVEPAGLVNSLAQLALKLTLPGVPDIYQGCELMDFSMVDPDNRRPVDFALRRKLLQETRNMQAGAALARWREGVPKLWLLQKLLRLRSKQSALFEKGEYEPLEVCGEHSSHALAFARRQGPRCIVVAVPRLVLPFVQEGGLERWVEAFSGTRVHLPAAKRFTSINGETIKGRQAPLSQLWKTFPVVVLLAE